MKRNHNRRGPKSRPEKSHCSSAARDFLSRRFADIAFIKKALLDHMKSEHPEWLGKMSETGELFHFIDTHAKRVMARYRVPTKRKVILWGVACYVGDDPLFEHQKRTFCPRHKGDPVDEEGVAEIVDTIRKGKRDQDRAVFVSPGHSRESKIVRAVADEACLRVRRMTIAHLQGMTDSLLANPGSGLRNAWDAICVEVQLGRSNLWQAFAGSVGSFVAQHLKGLRSFEREAIWLQTVEGQRWLRGQRDAGARCPVVESHIIDYVADYFVYWEAYRWHNPRIRAFVEQRIHG